MRLIAGLVFAAALLVSAQQGHARTAAGDRLSLRYEVYGSGIHALSASMRLDVRPDRYAAEIAASTRGTIGFLFPWSSLVRSDGAAVRQTLKPRLHELTSTWRGEPRSVFLEYDGTGGFLARRAVPPANGDEREPVGDDVAANTVDSLTAILEIMRRIASGESCNQTVAVFDGRRRFDLVSTEQGLESIPRSSYSAYSGTAMACAIRIQPVAGFWKKRQRRFVAGESGSEGQTSFGTLWFAQLPDSALPVPVRLKVNSPFGDFIGHLAAYERLHAAH